MRERESFGQSGNEKLLRVVGHDGSYERENDERVELFPLQWVCVDGIISSREASSQVCKKSSMSLVLTAWLSTLLTCLTRVQHSRSKKTLLNMMRTRRTSIGQFDITYFGVIKFG
ncbi:hypothetical protein Pmani_031058 [Petrolisthes manimaculis]|uniref:Uncharacterized protein n=1 Tax=Petrolisthes manimaculis TaxID=1843537 RepID=A0AAE1NWE0_9EUCA|nr:hypothetical protein Pmani_031058 [Petrolisthes manimaculis]